MYYEKQILHLDSEGNFLLAVHYPRHSIGGEKTRESSHAYFAYGNIDKPEDLKDISALCLLERKPSSKEAGYCRSIADGQRHIAEQTNESPTSRKRYQENEWQYNYQAKLAKEKSNYVPRCVMSSLNGIVALGLDIEKVPAGGSAILRFIDVFAEKALADNRESQGPRAQSILHLHTISVDGKSVLMTDTPGKFSLAQFSDRITFIEKGIPNLKPGTKIEQPAAIATFLAANGKWIAIDDKI